MNARKRIVVFRKTLLLHLVLLCKLAQKRLKCDALALRGVELCGIYHNSPYEIRCAVSGFFNILAVKNCAEQNAGEKITGAGIAFINSWEFVAEIFAG